MRRLASAAVLLLFACASEPESHVVIRKSPETRARTDEWQASFLPGGALFPECRLGDALPEGSVGSWGLTLRDQSLFASAPDGVIECATYLGRETSGGFPLQQLAAAGVTLREPVACLYQREPLALVCATNDPQLYVGVAPGWPDHFVSLHRATSRAALLRAAAKSDSTYFVTKVADEVFAALDAALAQDDDAAIRATSHVIGVGAGREPDGPWASKSAAAKSAVDRSIAERPLRARAELDGLAAKRAADWPQLDSLARWVRLRDDVDRGARLANTAGMKSWPERAQLEAEAEALLRAETAKANDPSRTLGEACWAWIRSTPQLARGVHEGMASTVVKLLRCDRFLEARRLFDHVTNSGIQAEGKYVKPCIAIGGYSRILAVDPLARAARREADRCDAAGTPAMALWWRSGVAQWLLDTVRGDFYEKHAVPNFYPRLEEIEATARALAPLDAAIAGKGSPFARVGMYATVAAAVARIEDKQPFANHHLRRAGSLALRAGYRLEAAPLAQLAEAYAGKGLGAAAAWTQLCAVVAAGSLPDAPYHDFVAMYDKRQELPADLRRFLDLAAPLVAELGAPIAAATSNAERMVEMQHDDVVVRGLPALGFVTDAFTVRVRLGLTKTHLAIRQGPDGTAVLTEQPTPPTAEEQWADVGVEPRLTDELSAEFRAIEAELDALDVRWKSLDAQLPALAVELQRKEAQLAAEAQELAAKRASMNPDDYHAAERDLNRRVEQFMIEARLAKVRSGKNQAQMEELLVGSRSALARKAALEVRIAQHKAQWLARFDAAVRPAHDKLLRDKLAAWTEQRQRALPDDADRRFELACGAFFAGLGDVPAAMPGLRNRAAVMLELIGLRARLRRTEDPAQMLDGYARILEVGAAGPLEEKLWPVFRNEAVSDAYGRGMCEDLRRRVTARFPQIGLDAQLPELLAYMSTFKTL